MTSSILTNASAMTALRVLNQINNDLSQTQNRISTGLKVASAKDNASFWAVSAVMKSDVNSFKAIGDNLSLAENSLSVARTGAEQISKLIDTIKSKTTAAQEGSIDKAALQSDIDAALEQIEEITKSANFNGVKLLETTSKVRLLSSIGRDGSNVDASYISFTSQDLTFAPRGGLESIGGLSVLDRGDSLVSSETDGVPQFDMGGLDATRITIDDNAFDFDATSSNNQFRLYYTDTAGAQQTLGPSVFTASDGNDLAAQLTAEPEVTSAVWDDTNGLTIRMAGNNEFDRLVDIENGGGAAVGTATGSSAAGGVTLNYEDVFTARAGNELTFSYTDEDGVARTLNHTLSQDISANGDGIRALVEELNNDKDFSALFNISYDSTSAKFSISAADRDTDITITDWEGAPFTNPGDSVNYAYSRLAGYDTGATADNVFTLSYRDSSGSLLTETVALHTTNALTDNAADFAGLTAVASATWTQDEGLTLNLGENYEFESLAATGAGVTIDSVSTAATPSETSIAVERTQEMTFQDAPLRLGEEIALNYKINNVNKEVVLRVTGEDTATGTRLDDQSNPNRIVLALDAREVTHASTSGKDIASEIQTALSSSSLTSDFRLTTGAAAVSSNVNFSVNENKLSITTAASGFDTLDTATLPITDYDALLDSIEEAMQVAVDAAAALGSAQGRIEIQKDFITELTDNLTEGVGTLVDANMNEESARLQALQVQQQLGIQSLSIANQAPQALLQLFQ